MWNFVIAEINKQNSNNVPPLNNEGSPANDYQELACVINEYFINVTNLTQTGNLKDDSSVVENLNIVCNRPFGQIDLTPVTAEEIKNIIRSLTLRLLISYIYGAPSKARNANVVYIWTYVWQR